MFCSSCGIILCIHVQWIILRLGCLSFPHTCVCSNLCTCVRNICLGIGSTVNAFPHTPLCYTPVGLLPSSKIASMNVCRHYRMCCTCMLWMLRSCGLKQENQPKKTCNETKAFKDDGKKRCPGRDSNPRPPALHCRCSTTELPRHIKCIVKYIHI